MPQWYFRRLPKSRFFCYNIRISPNRTTRRRSKARLTRAQALGCALGVTLCVFAVAVNRRLELMGSASSGSVNVQLTVLGYDDDVDPPYVEDMTPASGATLVGISSGITLHIKDFRDNNGVDAGSGVDLTTVQVTISYGATSVTYVDGDPEFTASGITVNRIITINPASDFPYSTRVTVSVRASDLHVPANVMSVFRYSFLTEPDSTPASSSAPGGGTAPPSNPDDPNGGHRGERDDQIHGSLDPEDVERTVRERCLPGNEVIERILPQSGDRRGCDTGHAGPPYPKTPFPDVPAGAWYEDALAHFVLTGIIDGTQPLFRPADGTLRAEMATVLVRLAGIKDPRAPVASSFTDVLPGKWYYPFVEEAAQRGWMLGYGDCFGIRHPCEDRPENRVTRAEAAKMIVRAYGLEPLGLAPGFADMPPYAWYLEPVSIAADHCIIQGDGERHLAYPESTIARSELVMMLYRAEQQLRYGRDCTRGSPYAGALGMGGLAAFAAAETFAVLSGALGMWAVSRAVRMKQPAVRTRKNGSRKPHKVTSVSYSASPSARRSRRRSRPKRRA